MRGLVCARSKQDGKRPTVLLSKAILSFCGLGRRHVSSANPLRPIGLTRGHLRWMRGYP
jgi:hypothetical protein